MKNLGRISIAGIAPLRAVLAFVFLVMYSLQPGFFATANATGFHSGSAVMSLDDKSPHDTGGHVGDHKDATAAGGQDVNGQDPGDKDSADKSCEVHCVPLNAVPVGCQDIDRAVSRCFASVVAVVLPLKAYTTLIRPPQDQ